MKQKDIKYNRAYWLRLLQRWTIPSVLIGVWQLASASGWISQRILPAPWDVVSAFWTLSLKGELLKHFLVSFHRAATGIGFGALVGLIFGLLVGSRRSADLMLDGTLQMLRNVPQLALIPLVIIWFGVGETAKVFLVALSTFFPIYVNTVHGIRSIDPRLLEMANIYNLKPYEIQFHIVIPGALPSILVGLRQSLGIAWLSLVVAETVAATSGIGYLAMDAREFMRTDVVVMCIIIYALLGKWADLLVRWLERRLLPWHPLLTRV
jgi:sulfonate transport system permease protein